MSQLYFAYANNPIVKLFNHKETVPASIPYNISSYTEKVSSLESMFNCFKVQGAEGKVLFRGKLKTTLIRESRKNSHVRGAKTNWLVLDIDGADKELDELLEIIGLNNVSYIKHHSSSAKVKQGTYAHCFFLLPKQVKISELNSVLFNKQVSQPKLIQLIRLAGEKDNLLKYPFDPMANREGGLLFIGNPKFIQADDDPYKDKDRWELVEKENKTVSSKWIGESKGVKHNYNKASLIKAALRTAKGLETNSHYTFKAGEDRPIELNAEPWEEYEVQEDAEFTRFRTKPTQRWPYYHPIEKPYLVYSFKEFVIYRTEDVMPEYFKKHFDHDNKTTATVVDTTNNAIFKLWNKIAEERAKELKKKLGRDVAEQELHDALGFVPLPRNQEYPPQLLQSSKGSRILCHYQERQRLARYEDPKFNCFIHRTGVVTGSQLGVERYSEAVYETYGYDKISLEEVKPCEIVYHPDELPWISHGVDQKLQQLNTFSPSGYMYLHPTLKEDGTIKTPLPATANSLRDIAPNICYILENLLNDKGKVFTHFVNWLAFILRFRGKTQTAWLMHGVPGTGKGLLFNYVLRPLLGVTNVSKLPNEINPRFPPSVDKSLLILGDELDVGSMQKSKGKQIMDSLKAWITEDEIVYAQKFEDEAKKRNPCNFIFFSNRSVPIVIEPKDRRFNVAERQNKPINVDKLEIERELMNEVGVFAQWLFNIELDLYQVKTPIKTKAKSALIKATASVAELVSEAINKGDIDGLLAQAIASKENFDPRILKFNELIEITAVSLCNNGDNLNGVLDNSQVNTILYAHDNDSFMQRFKSRIIEYLQSKCGLENISTDKTEVSVRWKKSENTKQLLNKLQEL
jgi:hypothetical protein